jgi:hypothetical protein
MNLDAVDARWGLPDRTPARTRRRVAKEIGGKG